MALQDPIIVGVVRLDSKKLATAGAVWLWFVGCDIVTNRMADKGRSFI